jgi:hypothetical protein
MRCSSGDLWRGLNEPKGYSALLILVVDAGMDDPRRLGRSRPLPALRSTKHDKVFTYDIGATRGTHLAHLGLTVGDGGG